MKNNVERNLVDSAISLQKKPIGDIDLEDGFSSACFGEVFFV
jgi:hypothetical protein